MLTTTQHQQRLFCRAFRALSSVEHVAASLATLHRSTRLPRSTTTSLALLHPSHAHRSLPQFNKPVIPLQLQRTLITTATTTATTTLETLPRPPPPEVIPQSEQDNHDSGLSIKPVSKPRAPRKESATPWTEQEDEFLSSLRQRKTPWKIIAQLLKRPVGTCHSRYYRFLDPYLADAVKDDAEDEADEATQTNQVDTDTPVTSDSSKERRRGLPRPCSARRLWTTQDRDRLEALVLANTPWPMIAKELQRNQGSCREKWFRIQKKRVEAKRYAKRIQSDQWNRLFKEGFRTHHRDMLVKAIERQLKGGRSMLASDHTHDPLGLLDMVGYGQDDSPSEMMMTMGRITPQPGHEGRRTDTGTLSTKDGSQGIDWNMVAQALDNKFLPLKLESIYHEMAATKLIWTPEEDDRLIRAVIRLGPPELQPKLWTMIKDGFGDVIRTSEDYKDRWRELDMPLHEREWDLAEKTKFWRRWLEFQEDNSLLSLPVFSGTESTSRQGEMFTESETTLSASDPTTPPPSQEVTSTSFKVNMWDTIAEGLEYRHGKDCQLYFERTTARFPRDPEEFQHLVEQYANAFLEQRKVSWTAEATEILTATVNSYLKAREAVPWKTVAKALDSQYTPKQCLTRWSHLSQIQNQNAGNQGLDPNQDPYQSHDHSPDQHEDRATQGTLETSEGTLYERAKPRLWSDHELNLLHKGVQAHGYRWARIRDALLPHRTVQMLHERYWRSQAKRAGRFSEKERSLLETAITTFGEDANWNLIASQVPGRTASQCRKSWNYGRTHHIQRQDEPWTEEDRQRLKRAVERFGAKKWTLISEFVIGKTPGQCRKQWEERMDPRVNTHPWSNREMDRLMERVEMQMSRKEEEAKARMSIVIAQHGTNGTNMEDGANQFENLVPRFKGKRKVDWKEVAKGMEGRTPQQCRLRFMNHRALYRIKGDY